VCKRKNESDERKKSSVKYYHSKEKNAKLYGVSQEKLERFCTQERLDERWLTVWTPT
jgi:hypothetical protein